jgi:hypothetical protein
MVPPVLRTSRLPVAQAELWRLVVRPLLAPRRLVARAER